VDIGVQIHIMNADVFLGKHELPINVMHAVGDRRKLSALGRRKRLEKQLLTSCTYPGEKALNLKHIRRKFSKSYSRLVAWWL
jgi:hypothetical protein